VSQLTLIWSSDLLQLLFQLVELLICFILKFKVPGKTGQQQKDEHRQTTPGLTWLDTLNSELTRFAVASM